MYINLLFYLIFMKKSYFNLLIFWKKVEITIKIHSNLTSKIIKVNKKMNNFKPNNILTIYKIYNKSLINI